MANNSDPRPPAVFPVPPPLMKLPFIDMRTGMLTIPALNFLQVLWAGIQGRGGLYDLVRKQPRVFFGLDGGDGEDGPPGPPGKRGPKGFHGALVSTVSMATMALWE